MSYLSHLESLIDKGALDLFFISLEKRNWFDPNLSRHRKVYERDKDKYDVDFESRLKLSLRSFLKRRKMKEELGLEDSVQRKEGLLFMCTNHPNGRALDFGKELKYIKQSLNEDATLHPIHIETDLSQAELAIHLSRYETAHVHIALHASKSRGILMSDSDENEYYPPEAFAELFKDEDEPKKLVLLNACHSLPYAEALKTYVRYAIGMKDFWPDDAASQYSKAFYKKLEATTSVEQAHQYALSELAKCKDILELHEERDIKTPLLDIPTLIH